MSKFINTQNNQLQSNNIASVSEIQRMKAMVLNGVSIPMYFYNIIIPQLPGYFDNYPVNFDNDPRACCPLHDEDTPSFRYYEDTSSFYCFGCARGGNVINLHIYFSERMNGRNVSKDEAIVFLYKYFLEGNQSTTYIDAKASSIEQKTSINTDAQVVKFNIYRSNLERSITCDRTLKEEVKRELWKELDLIDVLLSINEIDVVDAEKYIKEKVKKLIDINSNNFKNKIKLQEEREQWQHQ